MQTETTHSAITAHDHYRRVRLCALGAAVIALPLGFALGIAGGTRLGEGGVLDAASRADSLAMVQRALQREGEERRERLACQTELKLLQASAKGRGL